MDTAMKLRAHADRLGLDLSDLARLTGLPYSTVERAVKGTARPKLETVAAIAKAMGVSVDVLVGLRDEPTPLARRVDQLVAELGPEESYRRLMRLDAKAVIRPEEGVPVGTWSKQSSPPEPRSKAAD